MVLQKRGIELAAECLSEPYRSYSWRDLCEEKPEVAERYREEAELVIRAYFSGV